MRRILFRVAAVLALAVPAPSRAHDIRTGDGVASSSKRTAVFSNPAFIAGIDEIHAGGFYSTDADRLFEQRVLVGGIAGGGTKSFGFQAALLSGGDGDSHLSAAYGGGFRFSFVSVGLSGYSDLTTKQTQLMAGLLFFPDKPLRVGVESLFTFFDNHVPAVAAGVEWSPVPLIGGVIDIAGGTSLESWSVKPGVRVAPLKSIEFSFSYGWAFGQDGGAQAQTLVRNGFGLGIYGHVLRWVSLEFYIDSGTAQVVTLYAHFSV